MLFRSTLVRVRTDSVRFWPVRPTSFLKVTTSVAVVLDPPEPDPDPEPDPEPDPDPVPVPEPPVLEVEPPAAEFTTSAAPPPQETSKNSPVAIRHALRIPGELLFGAMLETVQSDPFLEPSQID